MKTPSLSYLKIIKILETYGYSVRRQSGSHIILEHESNEKIVVVPRHDPVRKGTLLNIIRHTGLTKDEFLT
ncbi:MAG: type II toxin-antitoxin system HicA family toxin [Candidatus Altiarchaeota archaeon]